MATGTTKPNQQHLGIEKLMLIDDKTWEGSGFRRVSCMSCYSVFKGSYSSCCSFALVFLLMTLERVLHEDQQARKEGREEGGREGGGKG